MADTWNRASVPPLATDLIAKLEAFRPTAYQDSVGVWTVGYGTTIMPTGRRVQPGDTLRQGDALLLLSRQAQAWCTAITKHVTAPLTTGQAAALISWVHNLGEGNLSGSTMAAMINRGRADLAGWQLPGWIMAGGQKSLGLMRRRELERRVFAGTGGLVDYDAVWALGQAAFEPAYAQAFADTAAWRAGREPGAAAVAGRGGVALGAVQNRVAPATAARPGALARPVAVASPAVSRPDDSAATDALNDAALAAGPRVG